MAWRCFLFLRDLHDVKLVVSRIISDYLIRRARLFHTAQPKQDD
jgi:hypothetical protein